MKPKRNPCTVVMPKPTQRLRVVITAQADFDVLDSLQDLESWRDSIIEYGEIINERVQVVEVEK